MIINPEKFKKFGPVAWILVISAVLSSVTGLYALGAEAYRKLYLRTDISAEICNTGKFCAQNNSKFHQSLLRHVADSRRVSIDVTYETYEGPDFSCFSQGEYFWNFAHDPQEPEVVPLPMEDGDCSYELILPPGTFKFVNASTGTTWYRATGDFYVGASGLGQWLILTSAE
ncbi:hypothetical protein [Kordiimonas sp.]|uniref:hypothetical protein n=1 Tax=Kordiimonas sp. TaxID=1970157 RepID=UPI003A93C478